MANSDIGLTYAILLDMGLSYTDVKNLTIEEETFLIESYLYFNEKKYGKQSPEKKNQIKASGNNTDYKKEIEELKKERKKKEK